MAIYHPKSAPSLRQQAEPWTPEHDMSRVRISGFDKENGSPKPGDMILTFYNGGQSLYSKAFFEANYTRATETEQP